MNDSDQADEDILTDAALEAAADTEKEADRSIYRHDLLLTGGCGP